MFTVTEIETGKEYIWTLDMILDEINRDRSASWNIYDETDWEEGWKEWCEGDIYSLKV